MSSITFSPPPHTFSPLKHSMAPSLLEVGCGCNDGSKCETHAQGARVRNINIVNFQPPIPLRPKIVSDPKSIFTPPVKPNVLLAGSVLGKSSELAQKLSSKLPPPNLIAGPKASCDCSDGGQNCSKPHVHAKPQPPHDATALVIKIKPADQIFLPPMTSRLTPLRSQLMRESSDTIQAPNLLISPGTDCGCGNGKKCGRPDSPHTHEPKTTEPKPPEYLRRIGEDQSPILRDSSPRFLDKAPVSDATIVSKIEVKGVPVQIAQEKEFSVPKTDPPIFISKDPNAALVKLLPLPNFQRTELISFSKDQASSQVNRSENPSRFQTQEHYVVQRNRASLGETRMVELPVQLESKRTLERMRVSIDNGVVVPAATLSKSASSSTQREVKLSSETWQKVVRHLDPPTRDRSEIIRDLGKKNNSPSNSGERTRAIFEKIQPTEAIQARRNERSNYSVDCKKAAAKGTHNIELKSAIVRETRPQARLAILQVNNGRGATVITGPAMQTQLASSSLKTTSRIRVAESTPASQLREVKRGVIESAKLQEQLLVSTAHKIKLNTVPSQNVSAQTSTAASTLKGELLTRARELTRKLVEALQIVNSKKEILSPLSGSQKTTFREILSTIAMKNILASTNSRRAAETITLLCHRIKFLDASVSVNAKREQEILQAVLDQLLDSSRKRKIRDRRRYKSEGSVSVEQSSNEFFQDLDSFDTSLLGQQEMSDVLEELLDESDQESAQEETDDKPLQTEILVSANNEGPKDYLETVTVLWKEG